MCFALFLFRYLRKRVLASSRYRLEPADSAQVLRRGRATSGMFRLSRTRRRGRFQQARDSRGFSAAGIFSFLARR